MRAMGFFGGLLMLLGGMVMFAQIRTIADRDKTIEDLKHQLAVKSATVTAWAIGDLKPGTKYYACPEIPGSVSITGTGNAATTGANSSIIQKSNGSPCSNVVATGANVTIKCDPDALPAAPHAPKE